jgi:4-amino-4-deoxy-L-arabinose transferase-like glycosyltransferase
MTPRSTTHPLNHFLYERGWLYTFAVAFVAIVPRLFVAIAWGREPVWDGHYYHFGAERIAEGFGYSEDVFINGQTVTKPWVHYPVGYSAFLGLLYKVFGTGQLVAPVANAVLSTGLVVLVHRLARVYVSEARAQAAAILAALHPGLIAYCPVVMTEPLAGLLILASFLAALKVSGARGIALAGFIMGVATLVRPSSLVCVPLLLFTRQWNVKALLANTGIAAACCLVPVLPWTARNCTVMDGCALVSTNGGWNLAIGALTEDGRFRTLRADDGCKVVTGQVQQDRCWAQIGRRLILEDPIAWLSKAPLKLAQTFNHESFAVEYLHEANPGAWPEQRRQAGRALLTLFHRLLMIGAALSVVAMTGYRRRAGRAYATQTALLLALAGVGAYCFADDDHPFYLLALLPPLVALFRLPGHPLQGAVGKCLLGWLLLTALTHAVFFGDDRYHLVVTPALCILAAAALRPPRQAEASTPPLS